MYTHMCYILHWHNYTFPLIKLKNTFDSSTMYISMILEDIYLRC